MTNEELKELFPAVIYELNNGKWFAKISKEQVNGEHNFINLTYRSQYVCPFFYLGLEATLFETKEDLLTIIYECRKYLANYLVVHKEQV